MEVVMIYQLTQPMEGNLVQRFLFDIATGKQDEVDNQLLYNPKAQELLTSIETFTDYSGRTFNCSAYEYAYWAKDKHMCRMLEQHMDEDTKSQMLQRCEAIEAHGLKYSQKSIEYCTRHFDLTPLKQALKNYIEGYHNWNDSLNYEAMKMAWMEVGLAQRDVPIHVINEYCRHDRSFDPTPHFNEDKLPRDVTFYNYDIHSDMALFPLVLSDSSGLGVDFALIRSGAWDGGLVREGGGRRVAGGGLGARRIDFAAICRLDEVRTADLKQSRENLKSVKPRLGNGFLPSGEEAARLRP